MAMSGATAVTAWLVFATGRMDVNLVVRRQMLGLPCSIPKMGWRPILRNWTSAVWRGGMPGTNGVCDEFVALVERRRQRWR
jgi:hypothetical protein